MSRADAAPALSFLLTPTPNAWVEAAQQHLPELLIDHANCEKKAASTAISLTFKYVDRAELLYTMSRLAREELRHFEQVLDVMSTLQISYQHLNSARYAQSLHRLVSHHEPARLVDLLILGAVVEARSCERFVQLMDVVPEPASTLYRQLLHSEARHFQDYLGLAEQYCDSGDFDQRVEIFLQRDAELVTSTDPQFRFHSGSPS